MVDDPERVPHTRIPLDRISQADLDKPSAARMYDYFLGGSQ